jgi:hypothetical protein
VFNLFPHISKYIHRPWCASLLGQPESTPEVKPTATPKPVETKKVEFIKEIKPTETK